MVLAAGQGRRLARMGHTGPKWLAGVAGRPIAAYQLDAVRLALPPTTPLVVVGGHRFEELRAWLAVGATGMRLELVENPAYAELNNWYSLLMATRHLDAMAWPGPTVILNSDLCATPSWFQAFLAFVGEGLPSEGALAVDLARRLTDEAMKVSLDSHRVCRGIGKVGVADPGGEYVGMAAVTEKGRALLTAALEEFVDDSSRGDDWYEAAFQLLMDRHRLFTAWPTPDSRWVEIDDEADWAQASELMAKT